MIAFLSNFKTNKRCATTTTKRNKRDSSSNMQLGLPVFSHALLGVFGIVLSFGAFGMVVSLAAWIVLVCLFVSSVGWLVLVRLFLYLTSCFVRYVCFLIWLIALFYLLDWLVDFVMCLLIGWLDSICLCVCSHDWLVGWFWYVCLFDLLFCFVLLLFLSGRFSGCRLVAS